MVSVCLFELRIMSFNKFFYMGLLEVEHVAVTENKIIFICTLFLSPNLLSFNFKQLIVEFMLNARIKFLLKFAACSLRIKVKWVTHCKGQSPGSSCSWCHKAFIDNMHYSSYLHHWIKVISPYIVNDLYPFEKILWKEKHYSWGEFKGVPSPHHTLPCLFSTKFNCTLPLTVVNCQPCCIIETYACRST